MMENKNTNININNKIDKTHFMGVILKVHLVTAFHILTLFSMAIVRTCFDKLD